MKKLIPVLTGAIMLLSLAACGSTKTAAEAIAAATGGDLLELEPAEPRPGLQQRRQPRLARA